MQKNVLIINTDGGSRGNPGPAACAFVAELDNKVVGSGSDFLGTNTNNFAEYKGVILALKWLEKNKNVFKNDVIFLLDSELVVKQLNGIYKIKKTELQNLSFQIKKTIGAFSNKIIFKNIPREKNAKADQLLNQELNRH